MNTENKGALAMAIIGNTLNLGYNIPFVYLVWKNRSSKNISGVFLLLRFWGSVSWLIYAILVADIWVGISYTVTFTATCMIYYVKFNERKEKIEQPERPGLVSPSPPPRSPIRAIRTSTI